MYLTRPYVPFCTLLYLFVLLCTSVYLIILCYTFLDLIKISFVYHISILCTLFHFLYLCKTNGARYARNVVKWDFFCLNFNHCEFSLLSDQILPPLLTLKPLSHSFLKKLRNHLMKHWSRTIASATRSPSYSALLCGVISCLLAFDAIKDFQSWVFCKLHFKPIYSNWHKEKKKLTGCCSEMHIYSNFFLELCSSKWNISRSFSLLIFHTFSTCILSVFQ